jgi:putative sterol carrier protein
VESGQTSLFETASAGLQRIFQAESTANIDAAIQFRLTGENDLEFYTLIQKKTLAIFPGRAPSARVTMSMPAQDFLAMLSGSLSPTDAFASGKLKVGGNLFYAMKLAPVFKFGS